MRLRFIAAVLLAALTLPPASPARADERPDAYVAGYVAGVLESEFQWTQDEFSVSVRDAMVTVRTEKNEADRAVALARLRTIAGLRRVEMVVGPADRPPPPGLLEHFVVRTLHVRKDLVYFPSGNVFRPVIADPKEPMFFVSLRDYNSSSINGTVGAVGYGETFGLLRHPGKRPGDGFQVGIGGGLFAQFDLDTRSHDLINADYTVGIPISYRVGRYSSRLRVYHQSSHLGDEFILRGTAPRVNLSFESVELLLACDFADLRVYGGGEYLFDQDPSSFRNGVLSAGFDYIGARSWLGIGRPVLAVGLKSIEENDWDPGVNALAGVEFGVAHRPGRNLRLFIEMFRGHNPHGQFYQERTRYAGLGLYLGF